MGIGWLFVFGRAFRGYWWAFRVWPSISWVLVGISCLAEHFVGIGGHFVFGRAFRRYWWAFRVLLSISWVLVGISCLANRLALETSCLIRQSIRQNVSSGEGIFHPDVLGLSLMDGSPCERQTGRKRAARKERHEKSGTKRAARKDRQERLRLTKGFG